MSAVCFPGYGTSWGDTVVSNCSPCPQGYYGQELRETNACEPCMTTTYVFAYKGTLNSFTARAVTVPFANCKADCLAEYAQIVDRAWSLPATSGWVTYSANDIESCSTGCTNDILCQFVTFDYATRSCQHRRAAPSPPGYTQ